MAADQAWVNRLLPSVQIQKNYIKSTLPLDSGCGMIVLEIQEEGDCLIRESCLGVQ